MDHSKLIVTGTIILLAVAAGLYRLKLRRQASRSPEVVLRDWQKLDNRRPVLAPTERRALLEQQATQRWRQEKGPEDYVLASGLLAQAFQRLSPEQRSQLSQLQLSLHGWKRLAEDALTEEVTETKLFPSLIVVALSQLEPDQRDRVAEATVMFSGSAETLFNEALAYANYEARQG